MNTVVLEMVKQDSSKVTKLVEQAIVGKTLGSTVKDAEFQAL